MPFDVFSLFRVGPVDRDKRELCSSITVVLERPLHVHQVQKCEARKVGQEPQLQHRRVSFTTYKANCVQVFL